MQKPTLMMSVCFIALVFVALVSLAVVAACQFTGKLRHLVSELGRILVVAAFIELLRHCKPSLKVSTKLVFPVKGWQYVKFKNFRTPNPFQAFSPLIRALNPVSVPFQALPPFVRALKLKKAALKKRLPFESFFN
ncbi:hypothetical protein [Mesobacillus subterraneus]|uniref:hypothetical protein n=1 Tax=Mesobacillus subterraneus TaxID=285983 RepID=UPI001CFCCBBD|nr:hypothetical protein [Mesobacillus subterraneus]